MKGRDMKPISALFVVALPTPIAHAHASAEPHIHVWGSVVFAAILIGGCAWIGLRMRKKERAPIRKKDRRG